MEIHNTIISPGETKKIDVLIARLPSHSSINIVVTVSRAQKEGPVLLLMGGLHGDEINGIEIVRRVIDQNHHLIDAGTLICIPILNVYGFIHFSRFVPDGKDVNRSFPGNKNGSLASRVAYYLMKDIIPKIDYGVDFHTGGADRTNYPRVRCMISDPLNRQLADAFCAPFTLHSKYRPKSLRQAAARIGKKIIVFEGGESSRFDEFAIQEGINGALRLMKYLKMTSGTVPDPLHNNHLINKSSWVRARVSGIFQSKVACGDLIKKNQIVGHITDPFGDYQLTLKSKYNGYVIGLNNNPIVHQGDALMHLGIENT
jgi:predicted deacylase